MSKKPYKVRAKNYNKKQATESSLEDVKVPLTTERKQAKPKKAAKKKS